MPPFFFGGIAIVWLVTIAVARAFPSLVASGGAAASMATGFGNLVMLGTPLALAHFGEEAAVRLLEKRLPELQQVQLLKNI